MHASTDPATVGQTVEQYLSGCGVGPPMLSMALAGYANTLCAKLDLLPRNATATLYNEGFELV